MASVDDINGLAARIVQLEAQVRFLYQHLGVTYVEAQAPIDPSDGPVIERLKKGDMLGAITLHRSIHGTGVPEAKTAIETLKTRLGI